MTEHDGTNNKRRASPNWSKISCMYCTKDSFSTLEALQLHIQAMHGASAKGNHRYNFSKVYLPNGSPSTGYACRLCTMVFPTSATLQVHASAAHGINEDVNISGDKHQCPQCSLNFKSLKSFAEHFVQNHGIPQVTPGKPTKSSSDQIHPTDLTVVRKEQSEKPPAVKRSRGLSLQVDIPQKTTPQMVQYDHPGILLCNQCNAALPDFESFRSHLKSHLDESAFSPGPPTTLTSRLPQLNICSYCGAHLPSSDDLTRHIGSHFLSTVTEYGCQSCYQLFQKPEDLQKHLLENHAQCWYRCTLCKELFESQAAIQVHFAVKHCNETKQYRCAACPNTAFLHSELEFSLHVRAVHCPLNTSSNPTVISSPRLHRCIFCNLTFNSEIEMHFHLAVHTKLFRCPACSESFHVEYFLEKHIQMCHPNQEKTPRHVSYEEEINGNERTRNGYHPPKSATSSFSSINNNNPSAGSELHKKPEPANNANTGSGNNNSHQLKLNNNNNNSIGACDICDVGEFATEAELDVHRKLVHHLKTSSSTKVSLHCAYCKESCKSRTELENHMKSFCQAAIGSNKHKCNICDELCLSTAALAEHKLTHCKVVHGSTCTHCKTLLTNEDCFISHSIQHSNANSGPGQQLVFPYPCVICRQTLSSEMETRLHAKFHLQTEVIQCSNCHQSHDRLDVIDGLCKICHSRARSSPSVCVHCHIHFESASILELHMAKNHQQSFKCSKCKECFETEKEFEAHSSQSCNGDNVYKCCLCLLLFPGPTQLQTHLIEHTFMGCSNFTCYICSSVFTTAHALQNHIGDHGLSARPYDCTKCSQKFFFRAELENHLFSHIDNPYLPMDTANKSSFPDALTSHFMADSEELKRNQKKNEGQSLSNGLNLIKHAPHLIVGSLSSDNVDNSGTESFGGSINNSSIIIKLENGSQDMKSGQSASSNEAERLDKVTIKTEKE